LKSGVNLKIDKMSTLRKKIGEALEGDSLDLREISKLFGIKEKEVLDHLTHIGDSGGFGVTSSYVMKFV